MRKGHTFRCTLSITSILISRILFAILLQRDNHLSGPNITEWLKRRSHTRWARPCTKVRNFAVAPLCFHKDYPEGYLRSFVRSRFCSHLSYCYGRALPVTLLLNFNIEVVFGLSSQTLLFE